MPLSTLHQCICGAAIFGLGVATPHVAEKAKRPAAAKAAKPSRAAGPRVIAPPADTPAPQLEADCPVDGFGVAPPPPPYYSPQIRAFPTDSAPPVAVPEPGAFGIAGLYGLGGLALALARRRSRRK